MVYRAYLMQEGVQSALPAVVVTERLNGVGFRVGMSHSELADRHCWIHLHGFIIMSNRCKFYMCIELAAP